MKILLLTLVMAVLAGSSAADVTSDATPYVEAMMTTLERGQDLDLDGEHIWATGVLQSFYGNLGNTPVWTNPESVRQLLAALEEVRDDGLDPDDYHGRVLTDLGAETPTSARALAVRDVLLSDALFVMLYHLVFGKADPNRLDADWNIDDLHAELHLMDAAQEAKSQEIFQDAISSGKVDALFAQARPDLPLYLGLRDHYARVRAIAENGGWPEIPSGPTVRKDDTDSRIPALRKRLNVTGDLAGSAGDDDRFDEELEAAVTRFQERHGLDVDGAVGRGTLASLNVSAADRAAMIRVNLERSRWVMHHEVGGDLVLVNIAAFKVWLIRDYDFLWTSRVQVGKPFTKTPVFADDMTYLEINPTWTVPVSIANRSILPKVKADPGYLADHDMVLLDGQGNEISPDTIAWAEVTRMPYTVRQQPGPKNSLGQVKFMFPNKHAVYLHDTPSRHNFGRSARAFSSGCIRVQNPFELAAYLLDDQNGWTPEKIADVVASGKRTTVKLTEPIPVFLLYWTAYQSTEGVLNFRDDIYGRDDAVLEALDGPVIPHSRHVN